MRMPVYGKPDRKRNVYDEVRNAVLYRKADELRRFAETDLETVMLVAREGDSIDPSIIAEICPHLTPRIVEFVAQLAQDLDRPEAQQVPEVIIRLARMPGVDPMALMHAYMSSCAKWSNQSILEGLDIYPIEQIERFIFNTWIQEHNCKGLLDLSIYHQNFDKEKWMVAFLVFNDVAGICDMIVRGLFDTIAIDDMAYQFAVDASSDVSSPIYTECLNQLFHLCLILEDKLNLSRIEDFLIQIDEDEHMLAFHNMFKTRSAIPDYLMVKKILHS